MALALEGTPQYGVNTGGGDVVLPAFTTSNPSIVFVVMGRQGGSYGTPTGSGLTFTSRGGSYSGANFIDVYYAIASSALAGVVITAPDTSSSYTQAVVFAVSGYNTSTPFDTNGSVPASGSADPISISTTETNTFIFGAFGGSQANFTPGSGWSLIASPTNGYFLVEYQIVSSAQTGLSVDIGTGAGQGSGAYADAIQASSGSAGSVTLGSIGLTLSQPNVTAASGTGSVGLGSIGLTLTQQSVGAIGFNELILNSIGLILAQPNVGASGSGAGNVTTGNIGLTFSQSSVSAIGPGNIITGSLGLTLAQSSVAASSSGSGNVTIGKIGLTLAQNAVTTTAPGNVTLSTIGLTLALHNETATGGGPQSGSVTLGTIPLTLSQLHLAASGNNTLPILPTAVGLVSTNARCVELVTTNARTTIIVP